MDSKFDLSDEELREAGEEAAKDIAVVISNSGLTPRQFFSKLGRKLEAMERKRTEREAKAMEVESPT